MEQLNTNETVDNQDLLTHIKLNCKILDAKFNEYNEEISEDVGGVPSNQIVLLIENLDTRGVFGGSLSEQDIQQITEMDHLLDTRELIDVAKWLRDCDLPFEFWVPKPDKSNTISTITGNTPIKLSDPALSANTSVGTQFKNKKKKND